MRYAICEVVWGSRARPNAGAWVVLNLTAPWRLGDGERAVMGHKGGRSHSTLGLGEVGWFQTDLLGVETHLE